MDNNNNNNNEEKEEEEVRAPDPIVRHRLMDHNDDNESNDMNQRLDYLMNELGMSYDRAVDLIHEGVQLHSNKRREHEMDDHVSRLMRDAQEREQKRMANRSTMMSNESKKHQDLSKVLGKLKQMQHHDLYEELMTFANNATQPTLFLGQGRTDELLQVVTELVDNRRLTSADLDALLAYISDNPDDDGEYEYTEEGGSRPKPRSKPSSRSRSRSRSKLQKQRQTRRYKRKCKSKCKRCGCVQTTKKK